MKTLLVIDMQRGFLHPDQPERNNPNAEQNALRVIKYFRKTGQPLIHIWHQSTNPQSFFYKAPGLEFMPGFEPLKSEPVFKKQVNSAFIGTDLAEYLRTKGLFELVVIGLTLPHCVSTTVRMAGNLGFDTILLSDATATFALPDENGKWLKPADLHQAHLAALNGEFAQVMTSTEFLRGY